MIPIAAIFTCRDQGRLLEASLASALAQAAPLAELIVVDLASTEPYTRQALAALEGAGTRIVRARSGSPPVGWNAGVRLASAPAVVLLGAGALLGRRWTEHLAAALDPGMAFAILDEAAASEGPRELDLVSLLSTTAAPGTLLVDRALWEKLGGVDENLGDCADLDLALRALQRGLRGVRFGVPGLSWGQLDASPRYRGVSRRAEHAAALRAMLEKHAPLVRAQAPAILQARRALGEACIERRLLLAGRRLALEQQLEEAGRAIEGLSTALSARGRGRIEWGDFERLTPHSASWGIERGGPIDRQYIAQFLQAHAADIHGRVLEVRDCDYTHRFGGARVSERAVIDVDPANARATVIADLARADGVPSDRFDCFILTQTLQYIYEARAALAHAFRILKPGGVLLCTVPAVTRVDREPGLDRDHWRFTEASLRAMFAEVFPVEAFEVRTYGNVLVCAAFLYGLAPEELTTARLDHVDPWFPLMLAVRARKPGG